MPHERRRSERMRYSRARLAAENERAGTHEAAADRGGPQRAGAVPAADTRSTGSPHPVFRSEMTHDSPERQRAGLAGSDEWSMLSDELLQGLVHALNNRVAALSAFVELARFGDEEADPLVVLPAELTQLHRVNSLFAMLPMRGSEP